MNLVKLQDTKLYKSVAFLYTNKLSDKLKQSHLQLPLKKKKKKNRNKSNQAG